MTQMIVTGRGKWGINRSEYPGRKQGHGQPLAEMLSHYGAGIQSSKISAVCFVVNISLNSCHDSFYVKKFDSLNFSVNKR